MHISPSDGNDRFDDSEFMDVQTRREVNGRGHGTVAVQAEEVFFQGYGRRTLGVEFAGDGAVLDGDGFGVGAYNVEGFVMRRGFGAADGGFFEGEAVGFGLVGCASAWWGV